MSHVVLSKDASGEPTIDEVGSLDEALKQVERLRNEQDVSDVRILREVPIEVKTYYKVVAVEDGASPTSGEAVPAPPAVASSADGGQQADPPSGSAVLAPPSSVAHVTVADDIDAASADRRTSLFGRS